MNINRWIRNKFIKKVSYEDRYIVRLPSSTMGCGMLHPGNIYLMDYAVRNMPTGAYVMEIGSWAGLSTNLLLHLMKKYGRKEKFTGCDPWLYSYNEGKETEPTFIDGREDISRMEYMDYIRQGFINSVTILNKTKLPFTCHLTSDEYFERIHRRLILTDVFGRDFRFEGGLSFCYIDGNHTYEYVKRDFENVDQHLLRGGMILLDDSDRSDPFGSARFMREVKMNPSYKVIARNPNYLVQKIS